MKKLLNRLFGLNRSLMGPDNDYALEAIGSHLPLGIHSFASGTQCFDWKVPNMWALNKAQLIDDEGKLLVDGDNVLNIVNYSTSFSGAVMRDDLDSYLHTDPSLPTAIPYRTSYYKRTWGFCLPYKEYAKLNSPLYHIEIDSEFVPWNLNVGEACLVGRGDKEIILTSYLCHPRQAHDGLSGVMLLILLYDLLKKEKLNFSYRFFFGPETIGTLCLLSSQVIRRDAVEFAMVATCVGTGNELNYKSTFKNNHSIDNLVPQWEEIKLREYYPYGSDERQFSSPGMRIPTCSLMRTPYQQYPEYHTSLDNLDFISIKKIEETAKLYRDILLEYDRSKRYRCSSTEGGEPFLSDKGLYRTLSVPGHEEEEIIQKWVLFLADGEHSVYDMQRASGFPSFKIKEAISKLEDAGLIVRSV